MKIEQLRLWRRFFCFKNSRHFCVIFLVLIWTKANEERVYTCLTFLIWIPWSSEKCEESILDLAKSKRDSQLRVSNLGILLRANSAAHLETLPNTFYNWILQETLTIGIVHNMLKWQIISPGLGASVTYALDGLDLDEEETFIADYRVWLFCKNRTVLPMAINKVYIQPVNSDMQ